MKFKLSIDTLFQYLQKINFDPKMQDNQIFSVKKRDQIEMVHFFRLIHEGELLQILTGLPFQLKEERYNDVARLLHKLNLDLDVPGFGMDERTNLIFYRSMIACPNKMCDPADIEKYIEVGQKASSSFAQVIAVVAMGHMTYEQLLQKAKEV